MTDEELKRTIKHTSRTLYMVDRHLKQCEEALYHLRSYYDEILSEHRKARFELAERKNEAAQHLLNRRKTDASPALSLDQLKELIGDMSEEELAELLDG